MFGNKEKKEEQQRIKREAAEAAQQRENERLEAARAKRQQDVAEYLQRFHSRVRQAAVERGRAVLYKEVYIPVDAQMNQFGPASGLDLEEINSLGVEGWAVESVIPRTYGGFESYKISKTTAYGVSGWGKDEHKVGLGGHIVGVYALLSYVVTEANLVASERIIDNVAHESMPDELRTPVG